ncbi:hypothetical protein BC941DRAFT_408320 [Chlamydoabsidia padenii]|nr:hypothetical protein BC941DRAFT_408320 [Chlamydoabsidia padenii]
MSTLKTFGFNVRRKRTQESPTPSKQDKNITSTHESSVVFTPAAASPIDSFHLHKSKPTKRKSPPKQATLLPFFFTQQQQKQQASSPKSNTRDTPSSQQQQQQQQQQIEQHSHLIPQQQSNTDKDDENEVCQIRRRVSLVDLLPLLMETYHNDVDDFNSHNDQQQTRPMILLQVKPSKTIYAIPGEKTQERPCLRRQRQSEEKEQVKKRSCSTTTTILKKNHTYPFLDEFDSQEDDNGYTSMRHCLSTQQVNSLLLDIANEYLAFDNNAWCATYLG